jgi:hypothetical protein
LLILLLINLKKNICCYWKKNHRFLKLLLLINFFKNIITIEEKPQI